MAKKKSTATKTQPRTAKPRTVSTPAPATSTPASATGSAARPQTVPAAAYAKPGRLSALDAAARVLAAAADPMNAKQLIQAMAAQGLWTSPGGATPHATLYSSIIREIASKGAESRFRKADRGKFAAAK